MKLLRKILLLPFSLIFGFVVLVRNYLYKVGIFNSKKFKSTIISVGNLSAGGTGKTPHIEYLITLLKKEFKVATLSRGYKRKTKGFILANTLSDVKEIGDEPMQYLKKHSDIYVAVDENRANGVINILANDPTVNVFLLDDAYQHQSIARDINILVTDYNNLYSDDWLLPSGNLREWRCESNRADVIIVSKTPKDFSDSTQTTIINKINPKPFQKVFFTYIHYSYPILFSANKSQQFGANTQVLCITGIANPQPFLIELNKSHNVVEHLSFPDHYNYSVDDVKKIKQAYSKILGDNKAIITTEKDIMRLYLPEIKKQLDDIPVYYIPIEVCFHGKGKEEFDKLILEYVRKNSGN